MTHRGEGEATTDNVSTDVVLVLECPYDTQRRG